ncbi:glucose and ribitol dehydrogenase-like [Tripterygium wilfordii]|uniref:glucose and ribitol dehydrogenase-like n=1 Tax=Tripterygium wilfordii TaxID=458696 RepID=UPI0018F828AB|nr:glucose and ribitol dehydrogenase-like [Tripterygium wilfordii]
MASQGQQFPPQKQAAQPGKEHPIEPRSHFTKPDYKPSNKLHGMVALTTGGDSGIGRAVCHSFAMEGATKTSDAKDPLAIPTDSGFEESGECVQNIYIFF